VIDPLYLFVFFGLFSPGPNVILLTTSGARFGFAATVPHLLGVAAGVGVTSALTGLGIGALLLEMPMLTAVLRILAAGWMLWMAWGLWQAKPAKTGSDKEKPMTFWQAVLFQWINPKVWAVAFVAVSAYPSGGPPMHEALRLATAFSGINLGVCLFWTAAGALLSWLLTSPQVWQIFMRAMALALAAFSAMVILSGI